MYHVWISWSFNYMEVVTPFVNIDFMMFDAQWLLALKAVKIFSPWPFCDRFDKQTNYTFVGDYSGQITVLKVSNNGFEVITTLKGHSGESASELTQCTEFPNDIFICDLVLMLLFYQYIIILLYHASSSLYPIVLHLRHNPLWLLDYHFLLVLHFLYSIDKCGKYLFFDAADILHDSYGSQS